MKIGIHNADNTNFPNLALMKLSAHHRSLGHHVEIYDSRAPIFQSNYDKIYSSKVFNFPWKKTDAVVGNSVEHGGTGYQMYSKDLPDKIEHICPDYDIYNLKTSYGFLTRGCINKCDWCVVPEKEGNIRAHADIDEFLRHDSVILMDNNILAHNHGIDQIEKISKMDVKVDFNQGLDARLIDDGVARRLSRLKWIKTVRLACDTEIQKKHLQKAVALLRWHNTRPARYFVYVMIKDLSEETFNRLKFVKGLYCEPFAQPFIDPRNPKEPDPEITNFSRWVNHTAVFNSVPWEDYKYKSQ